MTPNSHGITLSDEGLTSLYHRLRQRTENGEGAIGSEVRYDKLYRWMIAANGDREPEGGFSREQIEAFFGPDCKKGITLFINQDLPSEERWVRDVWLRPYTRGLLDRHLRRRPALTKLFDTERAGAEEPVLNRMLLEDIYAEHVTSVEDQRLHRVFDAMRAENHAALCLSGGGIRSATFALGVVQGLARHGVLSRFSYLSTVSGGGYLGGWLSAWSRHQGFEQAVEGLQRRLGPLDPEAVPVHRLREYSNYLSPRLGLLSMDSWTLIATYLRNLALIWLVTVPFLSAIACAPWLLRSLLEWNAPEAWRGWLVWGGVGVAVLFAVVAVTFVHANRPEIARTGDAARALNARRDLVAFLRFGLLPLCAATLAWTLAWGWFETWGTSSEALEGLYEAFEFTLDAETEKKKLHRSTPGMAYTAGAMSVVHVLGWACALAIRGLREQATRASWKEGALVLFTGAGAGALLVLTACVLLAMKAWPTLGTVAYAVVAFPAFLFAALLAGYLFEGFASGQASDSEREWMARLSAWALAVVAVWLVVTGLVLFGAGLLLSERVWAWPTAGLGIGSAALAAYLGRHPEVRGPEAVGSGRPSRARGRLQGAVSALVLPAAAVLAVAALIVALSLLDMQLIRFVAGLSRPWTGEESIPPLDVGAVAGVHPLVPAAVIAALLALGFFCSVRIDTNRFSLHAMYRARLIRAYLGASRPAGERHPDPFTGFDETDDVQMGCVGLRGKNAPPADPASGLAPPFHVVNVALNLVAGRNLAWQERKAASFTVSPLHAGSMNVGYRRTRGEGAEEHCPVPPEDPGLYGGPRGITLGTAMTISGAAASPNMGYHSSPVVTFLMTLLNARLGWWLGNPGPAGDDTFHLPAPRLAVRPILDEMRGGTTDTNAYVYLSDGGHFENLGLYEMVLRRNRVIVVCDAGCDETFDYQDLGNAIRKIRIDLGIPIEFQKGGLPDGTEGDDDKPYWTFARIRYGCADAPRRENDDTCWDYDGLLMYVKPRIRGDEPGDVANYHRAHRAFPHESTADQFFTESQFESYRELGSHIADALVESFQDPPDGSPAMAAALHSCFLGSRDDMWGPLRRRTLDAALGTPP